MELFTKIGLWLGILAAAIGTVAQYIPADVIPPKIVSVVGSLLLAFAGAAGTYALAGNRDQIWLKCRAAGEAIKSSVYLYCAAVPPFDTPNRTDALGQRLEKALKDIQGLALRPGDMKKQPPGPLTISEYLTARVDDQITYYTNSFNKYQKKADFWRFMALAGTSASLILGGISAVVSLSPWIALLATVTTSVTAFVKNQRYETMAGLYQATAMRLQMLKDQWADSGKTEADTADRDSLIQRCEETMSLENGAWMAQWSQQPNQQAAGA
jgi:hypothetical protein